MHLASASLTPIVGFFSRTNTNTYGSYGHGSVALDTNKTNIEDWFNEIISKVAGREFCPSPTSN